MTPDQLDQLEVLLEEAAPGPLSVKTFNEGEEFWFGGGYVEIQVAERQFSAITDPGSESMARLIADAVNSLPALLEAARAAERYREALQQIRLADQMAKDPMEAWTLAHGIAVAATEGSR